ncbi:MAG: aminotransferase class V-fold PLP-dependent enzyme [Kiloniellales bacterium]|nr:aminotransferase class V-fold PLP-dependent enzyme [Kiloniellales bacterium]
MELDVEFCRSFFPPIENGVVYLENAGGSYAPRQVIDRLSGAMSNCQNQPFWSFKSSVDLTERLEASFQLMSEMIGANRDEIIVGPSTTLNVYVLAQALRPIFDEGDELVVTNQDHEANSGAWRRLAEYGITVKEWRVDPKTGELDPADLEGLLSGRTKLVCFPHVSNVVGTINPVKQIAAMAHGVGAMVCVDGVAYAAHGAIDVEDWDVDFYLFSLYKIYGPHLALLYGKKDAMAKCRNQNHFFHEGKIPAILNPGGFNYESVASLAGIVDYFEALHDHHFVPGGNSLKERLNKVYALFSEQEERLAEPLISFLKDRPGVRLIGEAGASREKRMPTISFSVEGLKSKDIVKALAKMDIAAGHGHFYGYRCVEALGYSDPNDGVVRISMVHYNTLGEMERVIAALKEII